MSSKWIVKPAALSVVILLLTGCEREEDPDEYIARVNNEYLTREMIEEKMDTQHAINEAMVQEYVNQWLTSEMLYQEARRRGLDRDDRVLEPLRDVRRNLAINALLEDEIYDGILPEVTDEQIEAYYEEHMGEFIADEPLMELSFASFEQRTGATSFRNSVDRGEEWDDVLDSIIDDEEQAGGVIEIGERGYYRESELYPPEIWRSARQLGTGGVSFPVAVADRYYIIRHHQTIQSGNPYPLEYVSNEIKERLVIEKRQDRYEELLLNLRRRYPIDVSFDIQPFDEIENN